MENNVVSFDSKTLKTALKIVSKAADTDQQPQRYALRCILVEVNPDGVNLIATNGKVMHICEFSTVHLSKNPFGITGQWLLTMEAWKAILATSTTKINRIDLVFNNQVLTNTDG